MIYFRDVHRNVSKIRNKSIFFFLIQPDKVDFVTLLYFMTKYTSEVTIWQFFLFFLKLTLLPADECHMQTIKNIVHLLNVNVPHSLVPLFPHSYNTFLESIMSDVARVTFWADFPDSIKRGTLFIHTMPPFIPMLQKTQKPGMYLFIY